jgi:hypothetical protein
MTWLALAPVRPGCTRSLRKLRCCYFRTPVRIEALEAQVQFEGAVVREQNVVFGIVAVKPHVLNDPSRRQEMQLFGARAFGAMPIALATVDSRGVPTYYGRNDIVTFLSKVRVEAIPWRTYRIGAA